MRGGPNNYETMDTEGGLKKTIQNSEQVHNPDAGLSGLDCSISSSSELAKLAEQSSHHP